jgi:hypothetical protein
MGSYGAHDLSSKSGVTVWVVLAQTVDYDRPQHIAIFPPLHPQTTISSGIVRAIVWPCIVSTLLALMVASYHAAFTAKPAWLPTWLPPPPSIAIEPIQLTTLALSLLLVFRYVGWVSRFSGQLSEQTCCRKAALPSTSHWPGWLLQSFPNAFLSCWATCWVRFN